MRPDAAAPSSGHVRILLGTRNGLPWLQAQLESYLAQTHDDWTLWVSDDGSTDGTREVLARFAARHPGRVARVVEGPRRGSAANYLQLLCHPDLPAGIVALSDQDDVWLPHKLARAVARLRDAGARPCAWSARYLFADAMLARGRASRDWPRPPSLGNAVVQNILSGHTITLNPAALELVRGAGPQAVPHHDWWIYLLLAATGAEILFDPAVVLHYRQHPGNLIGASAGARARAARVRNLLDGTLRGWIAANLRALERAPVALTPDAARLLGRWRQPGRGRRLRLMRECGVHRQSRAETALLHLAAALGRL